MKRLGALVCLLCLGTPVAQADLDTEALLDGLFEAPKGKRAKQRTKANDKPSSLPKPRQKAKAARPVETPKPSPGSKAAPASKPDLLSPEANSGAPQEEMDMVFGLDPQQDAPSTAHDDHRAEDRRLRALKRQQARALAKQDAMSREIQRQQRLAAERVRRFNKRLAVLKAEGKKRGLGRQEQAQHQRTLVSNRLAAQARERQRRVQQHLAQQRRLAMQRQRQMQQEQQRQLQQQRRYEQQQRRRWEAEQARRAGAAAQQRADQRRAYQRQPRQQPPRGYPQQQPYPQPRARQPALPPSRFGNSAAKAVPDPNVSPETRRWLEQR